MALLTHVWSGATGLTSGSYDLLFLRCRDAAGNQVVIRWTIVSSGSSAFFNCGFGR